MAQHTKSQEEVLLSDWLSGRRDASQGYVHKNASVGIKSTVRKGEAFSRDITGDLEGLDPVDLLKKARKAAENLANTISPIPVKVRLGNGSGSYNVAGKDITLDTDHFDRTDISAGTKTDILLGYAVHESAHSLHTDFEETQRRLSGADFPDLRMTLANIIEDERIEYLIGEEFPGYINYVGEVKKHLWRRLVKSKGPEPEGTVAKICDALLGAVRFPEMLDAKTVSEHFDELDAIRKVLTPFPATTEEMWSAVDRIMDVIRDLVKKELQQKKAEEGNSGDQSQQNATAGGASGGEATQQDKNDYEKQQANGGEPSKEEIEKEIERQLGSPEGRNALEQAKGCSGGSGSGTNESRSLDAVTTEYVNDDKSEAVTSGRWGTTYVVFPSGNKNSYMRSRDCVQKHIPATAVALTYRSEENDYCLQGMPSGKLNTNKFAAYLSGNTNIFSQQGQITCDRAAVCLLIDESGSMTSRLQQTRNAAILLNEAVKRIPKVDYYAYGYTNGRINVYAERSLADGYALGSTVADGGTPTGEAMRICAQRVRRHSKAGVLMLVLTDGNAGDSEEVRRQDSLLSKNGIIPIGVGIQTDCVRATFKHWLVIDNLATFPQQMAELTRKHLAKMLVRHDSMLENT